MIKAKREQRAKYQRKLSMHLEAVSLMKKGRKKKEIAKELGIHPITVGRWLKTYSSDKTSFYSETRGRKKGTHRALSLADEHKIVSTIRTNTPDRLKLPFYLWNQYAVHDWIKSEFRIDISLRSVRNYFRLWGINAQISTSKNIQTLKQLVGDKLETIDHPSIMKMASKKRAQTHWCFPKNRVFIFKDKNIPVHNIKPDINHTYVVSNAYMFKSVTNKNELQFMIYENQLTVHTYIRFMESLVKNTPRHIFTIFHRFRVKDRQLLLHWLLEHKEQVTMFIIS